MDLSFRGRKVLPVFSRGSHNIDGTTSPSSIQIVSHPSPNTNYDFQYTKPCLYGKWPFRVNGVKTLQNGSAIVHHVHTHYMLQLQCIRSTMLSPVLRFFKKKMSTEKMQTAGWRKGETVKFRGSQEKAISVERGLLRAYVWCKTGGNRPISFQKTDTCSTKRGHRSVSH